MGRESPGTGLIDRIQARRRAATAGRMKQAKLTLAAVEKRLAELGKLPRAIYEAPGYIPAKTISPVANIRIFLYVRLPFLTFNRGTAMQCRKCRVDMPDDDKRFCPYCGTRQEREPRKALKCANGMGTVYKLQGRRRRPRAAAKGKIILGY